MTTVDDFRECPRCKDPESLWTSFNCRTTEETHQCMNCGYRREWYLARTPDGELERTSDGKYIIDYKEEPAVGTVSCHHEGRIGWFTYYNKPITAQQAAELYERERQCFQHKTISWFRVNQWDPEIKQIVTLFEYRDEESKDEPWKESENGDLPEEGENALPDRDSF